MFFIYTARVGKLLSGDRHSFSGPFGSRQMAEKAALMALKTYSTVTAVVMSRDQVAEIASGATGNYPLQAAARLVLKMSGTDRASKRQHESNDIPF